MIIWVCFRKFGHNKLFIHVVKSIYPHTEPSKGTRKIISKYRIIRPLDIAGTLLKSKKSFFA